MEPWEVEANPFIWDFFFYVNKSGLEGPCVQCGLDENVLGSSSIIAISSGVSVSFIKWGCAIVVRLLASFKVLTWLPCPRSVVTSFPARGGCELSASALSTSVPQPYHILLPQLLHLFAQAQTLSQEAFPASLPVA